MAIRVLKLFAQSLRISLCLVQNSHTRAKSEVGVYDGTLKTHLVGGVWAKLAQLKPLVAVHAGGKRRRIREPHFLRGSMEYK